MALAPPYVPALATGRRRSAARRRYWRTTFLAYIFLLPAVLIIAVFHFFSVAFAFYISLFNWRVLRGAFLGLTNYWVIVQDADFHSALATTIWYAVLTVPPSMLLSLVAALLLSRQVRGVAFYRTLFFVPYVTSTVAAAVIWRWIFQPQSGIANALLNRLGFPGQQWADEPRGVFELLGQFVGVPLPGWLAGPSLALVTVAVVSMWYSVGFNTVIALAGLTSIPAELYEAARIDGATRWHLFRHITLPLLTPTLLFLLIVETIRAFQSFDFFYQMMSGIPVPGAKVVTIYLYQQGFKSFNLGYAASIGIVLFVIIFVLTLVQFRATRSRVVYAD
jgi:multiple sugar transport system permease protein